MIKYFIVPLYMRIIKFNYSYIVKYKQLIINDNKIQIAL